MPSYEKSKASGLWSCRFREVNSLGETHQKRLSGFKTKKEAQYAYEDYIKGEEAREAQKNGAGAFLFGGDAPLPATSIERHLTSCATAGGVKRIRVHDLRHSCASYLIHSGVSIVAVSRQLGHTDVEQTLNTYSHLLPDDTAQIRANLEKLGTELGTKK